MSGDSDEATHTGETRSYIDYAGSKGVVRQGTDMRPFEERPPIHVGTKAEATQAIGPNVKRANRPFGHSRISRIPEGSCPRRSTLLQAKGSLRQSIV